MKEIPQSFYKYQIELTESLCLDKTFDCGQCFRWNKSEIDGVYEGIAYGKLILASTEGKHLKLYSDSELDIAAVRDYFDLEISYDKINDFLCSRGGNVLTKAKTASEGIRILKQDFYETLISFIVSQNNNIPRIKGCIENICRIYGKLIFEYQGKKYYSFPEPDVLAKADPNELQTLCRVGYRAPFIVKASLQFIDGSVDISEIDRSEPDEAVKKLCGYYGVGNKVANCVLLFSGLRRDAFPVDVWVERMLESLYGLFGQSRKQMEKWGRNTFGKYAGIAQQYLFYYIRMKEE